MQDSQKEEIMSNCNTYKPTDYIPRSEYDRFSVFLAGSIEMGKAVDWQSAAMELFKHTDCVIFNPRRDDWDSTWVQSKHNKQFFSQVTWELDHLESAHAILLYFAADTISPISLLEMGLFYKTNKMFVVCDDNYPRKGNVDIVCDRYGITQYRTIKDAVQAINRKRIEMRF